MTSQTLQLMQEVYMKNAIANEIIINKQGNHKANYTIIQLFACVKHKFLESFNLHTVHKYYVQILKWCLLN